ncbi:MAG TPA: formyltransferase family protein [Terriglobales bacterium]|nr:formyltransferase family protein [Terriglobales bacterium]
MNRIGIIASSGGSVARFAHEMLRNDGVELHIVTDRPCGIEELRDKTASSHRRIEIPDNRQFSIAAREHFQSIGGVDFVVLFFLRLVTSDLLTSVPCFNIHPSLLPAYKGFYALQRAYSDRAKFFGATLHLATERMDSGSIVAQAIATLDANMSLQQMERVSFVQKLYLFLILNELWTNRILTFGPCNSSCEILSPTKLTSTSRANPSLDNLLLREQFQTAVAAQGIQWRP